MMLCREIKNRRAARKAEFRFTFQLCRRITIETKMLRMEICSAMEKSDGKLDVL